MNKILVSIVFAVILVLGINKITNIVYHVEKPKTSAFQVNVTTVASTETQKGSESSQAGDIIALFTSTSATDGAKVIKQKCLACHSIAQGGGNKIGPALWGVLGRKAGSIPDYKYSKAMAAHGKVWSFDEMNSFLIKPKDWIKGTKMSFSGLKNVKDRASIIHFMNKYTDNPLPLN